MSVSHVAPSYDAYWQAKRRKVRKGTHSCWECKRRKMKCIFDPRIASASCIGCRRRGSPCISQEFPEDLADVPMSVETSISDGTPSDGRARAPMPSERTDPSVLMSLSADVQSSRHHQSPEYLTTTRKDTPHKYEKLSRFLHELLPSRADIESICKASRHSAVLSHQLLTTPYTTLYKNGLQMPETLLTIPEPNVHPVLIARYMLQLALFLQHLPPDLHREIKDLSEPPRAIMQRLAGIAIYHVTTNEDLVGSIESLDCIMLESLYQVNIGNLRRSWVANRRAMCIAELMDFGRSDNPKPYKTLDRNTKCDPPLMWLRIIILDRHLCLLLGMPQGWTDQSMASETSLARDCPMGRLEHLHCGIMSRILERNTSKPSSQDLAATRAIDLELQKAAGSLPSKWWLIPKFDSAATDLQAMFWDTRRLTLQICHYNLLNQVHLPYMLRPLSSAESKYEYSRITCVNASREVLSRYIALRSFNRIAYSCRTVDFIALMAAMTLLLAHMDSHRDGPNILLANQYLSDRGMIEQVQEHMSEINRLNSDELSAQSADLLKALLAVDMENGTGRVSVRKAGSEEMMPPEETSQEDDARDKEDGEDVARVHIPYFGIIRIAREVPTKRQAAPALPAVTTTSNSEPQLHLSSLTMPPASLGTLTRSANNNPNPFSFSVADTTSSHEFTAPFAPPRHQPHPNPFSDPGRSLEPSWLMQSGYPELAAGGEDWAFQGVDMAFFESIMRNVGGGV